MGSYILRLPQVKHKIGLSRSAIYQLISLGEFPKQIKLGERSSGWLDSEINQWITQRIAKRDGAA